MKGINTEDWFHRSVFSIPAPGTFGNLGRNILAGPGFFNLDASLFKQFRITERWDVELRGEFFSVTNTPQLDRPNTSRDNANFGKVKGAGGYRGGQLGLKILF